MLFPHGRYLRVQVRSGVLVVMSMIFHRLDIPEPQWELRKYINWALGRNCKLSAPMTERQEHYKNTLIEALVESIHGYTRTHAEQFPRDALVFSKYDKENMINKNGVAVVGFSEYNPDHINPYWGLPRLRVTPYGQ